jgi:UDP-glucose 4-epimerase
VLRRLAALGADVSHFAEVDVTDRAALAQVFGRWRIEAVVHFAAKKAVGESVAQPLAYYANNVGGTIALAEVMQARGCKTIVFSSSASVYGQPRSLPVPEDAALEPSSPYAATKLMSENILRDVERADPAWRIALLRYFNPVGAHPSGTIGEDPRGTPNNLMPFVAQVAVGKRPLLQVFGSDYDTARRQRRARLPARPGSRRRPCRRAEASPGRRRLAHPQPGHRARRQRARAGAGVRARQRPQGPVRDRAAPPGDVAACYADPGLAERLLGWKTRLGLDAMCADSWRWQTANPDGYAGG